MSDEKIQVYFKPLAGGKFFHETLLYTNSNGEQFYATAYATKVPEGETPDTSAGIADIASDVGTASAAAATNAVSPYGTLITQWGPVKALSPDAIAQLFGPQGQPYDSQTLLVRPDLSENWSRIEQAYFQVGEQGLPYSPYTQNSDSTASTGLTAGFVPLPAGTGLFGDHWAPASGLILPTSMTPATPTPAFQPDAVYSPAGDFFGNFPRVSPVAAMPSPMAFNASPTAGDLRALAQGVPRLSNARGRFVETNQMSPWGAASPSVPLSRDTAAQNVSNAASSDDQPNSAYFSTSNRSPNADTNGPAPPSASQNFPAVRRISDRSQGSIFEGGAPAATFGAPAYPGASHGLPGLIAAAPRSAPMNPTFAPAGQASFDCRFGNWGAVPAGGFGYTRSPACVRSSNTGDRLRPMDRRLLRRHHRQRCRAPTGPTWVLGPLTVQICKAACLA
jgi:hypothetical protein